MGAPAQSGVLGATGEPISSPRARQNLPSDGSRCPAAAERLRSIPSAPPITSGRPRANAIRPRGISLSDRTPPPQRGPENMPKESTVPLPELATCRLMDSREACQAATSFNKERDSYPAERAGHARFDSRSVARHRDLARPDHLRRRRLFPSPACIRGPSSRPSGATAGQRRDVPS